MTRFDGIHVEDLVFDEKIKHMFQRIQPSIDGGRRQSLLMLLINKLIDLTK
jgi:hypothetical protein